MNGCSIEEVPLTFVSNISPFSNAPPQKTHVVLSDNPT